MTLGINLENFEKCHELLIPPNTNRDGVKLRLIDSKGRKLLLTIKISCRKGGCVNVRSTKVSELYCLYRETC